MFLATYYNIISSIEICDVKVPSSIFLQLWNDDVVIRNDHSTGKSRILLALHNEQFYIDEIEVYTAIKRKPTPANTAYILNINTNKFHKPSCNSVNRMKEKNKRDYEGPREELLTTGFTPCGNCNP